MSQSSPRGIRRVLRALGPGVVTGAADDDPAGIATYSIAGAKFGTALLWLAPLSWPLVAAVQMMCARVGMVTGCGLMEALGERFARPVLAVIALALFIANTFNVGADLAGMADAMEMLTTLDSRIWVAAFGVGIAWATIGLRYATIARILKWLTLVLLAYVVAAFTVKPDWDAVGRATFVPAIPAGREAWGMIVAILGTTISPYLFFWQSSEEVEEEKAKGRTQRADRVGATRDEIVDRGLDVSAGTLFSAMTFFFITLTTAMTLYRNGGTHVETTKQIASALEPVAGSFASVLYTVGLVGTGALAIPTLAGSGAYAVAEIFGWREGMDERASRAPHFYGVFALSIAVGIGMDFVHVSPVRALYLSAVINGVLAPFLLAGILVVASDRRIMNGQPSSKLVRGTVLLTTLLMFGAAAAMLIL